MNPTKALEHLPTALAPVAANEEFSPPRSDLTKRPFSVSGWSPYEVWYTRVRLEQKRLGLERRSAGLTD